MLDDVGQVGARRNGINVGLAEGRILHPARHKILLIKDDKLALVQKALKNHAEEWRYKAEIRKNMIVIHAAAQDYDWIDMLPSASGVNKGKIIEMKNQNTQYMPVMRFILFFPFSYQRFPQVKIPNALLAISATGEKASVGSQ